MSLVIVKAPHHEVVLDLPYFPMSELPRNVLAGGDSAAKEIEEESSVVESDHTGVKVQGHQSEDRKFVSKVDFALDDL